MVLNAHRGKRFMLYSLDCLIVHTDMSDLYRVWESVWIYGISVVLRSYMDFIGQKWAISQIVEIFGHFLPKMGKKSGFW